MQVDVTSMASTDGTLPSPAASTFVLLEEAHIHWRAKQERAAFRKLEAREFKLTSVYDPILLQNTGMDFEFDLIFQNAGWEDF